MKEGRKVGRSVGRVSKWGVSYHLSLVMTQPTTHRRGEEWIIPFPPSIMSLPPTIPHHLNRSRGGKRKSEKSFPNLKCSFASRHVSRQPPPLTLFYLFSFFLSFLSFFISPSRRFSWDVKSNHTPNMHHHQHYYFSQALLLNEPSQSVARKSIQENPTTSYKRTGWGSRLQEKGTEHSTGIYGIYLKLSKNYRKNHNMQLVGRGNTTKILTD